MYETTINMQLQMQLTVNEVHFLVDLTFKSMSAPISSNSPSTSQLPDKVAKWTGATPYGIKYISWR